MEQRSSRRNHTHSILEAGRSVAGSRVREEASMPTAGGGGRGDGRPWTPKALPTARPLSLPEC